MAFQFFKRRILAMLAATPETEEKFRRFLEKALNDAAYCAPEMMVSHYFLVSAELWEFFGDNPKGWQINVIKEWVKEINS